MDIDRRGREWARWPNATALPPDPLEISFDGGTTWTLMQRVDATTVRVLVAGPDAEGEMPDHTVTLREGNNDATIRVTASPEILVRAAGTITVH